MAILFLGLGILAFALALRWLKLVPIVARGGRRVRHVGALLRSPEVSDPEKEAAARTAAIALTRVFLEICWRSAVAVAAALALMWAGAVLNLYSHQEIAAAAVDPIVIGVAVVLSVIAMVVRV